MSDKQQHEVMLCRASESWPVPGNALLQVCTIPAVRAELPAPLCFPEQQAPLHPSPLQASSSPCPELSRWWSCGGEQGPSSHSKQAHPRGHKGSVGPAGWWGVSCTPGTAGTTHPRQSHRHQVTSRCGQWLVVSLAPPNLAASVPGSATLGPICPGTSAGQNQE